MARKEPHPQDDDKIVVRSVGRRKEASARVRLEVGDGDFVVNDKDLEDYFSVTWWVDEIMKPLEDASKTEDFDISVKVEGGGHHGQAEAIQHGIARALVEWDEDFKPQLKAKGYLTRDSREKERKKYGKRKARRSKQWRKR
ncbi:MAG: 30S ribosomal protein S9 [Candidatus Magasanikbacteria bacterium]